MKNKLIAGFSKTTKDFLPKSGNYLFIDDEVPDDVPLAKVFDPRLHSFNPLSGITHRKARELADALYTAYPEGGTTLTVRNGRRALPKALKAAKRFDHIEGDEEITSLRDDVLFDPLMQRVLCDEKKLFKFHSHSIVLARINRAEIGEFESKILVFLLITQYKGQIIIPDFGYYGRDVHTGLIRQNRLIAGVNYLDELTLHAKNAKQMLKAVKDVVLLGANYEDAKFFADTRSGFTPDQNGHSAYVADAMARA